jgi:hypothetical protein
MQTNLTIGVLPLMLQILIISMIVERIWEYVQLVLGVDVGVRLKVIISALLSVAAAISLGLDLLFVLQITEAVSLPGIVLTGVIIGLGSNLVHDILGFTNSLKTR